MFETQTLAFTVTASEQDTDPVVFHLGFAPPGAAIDQDGNFSWTPDATQLGDHSIQFVVMDIYGATDEETITITVCPYPLPTGDDSSRIVTPNAYDLGDVDASG